MPNKRRRKEEGLLTRLFSVNRVSQNRTEHLRHISTKTYRKQHGHPSTLRRNAAIGLVSLAALVGISTAIWQSYGHRQRAEITVTQREQDPNNPYFIFNLPSETNEPAQLDFYVPPEKLTLSNLKLRPFDKGFGQAYLDNLLKKTNKVRFHWTDVVYDPHVNEYIRSLENQLRLTEDPIKQGDIKASIEKAKNIKANLNIYREKPRFSYALPPQPNVPTNIALSLTSDIPNPAGKRNVFVLELGPLATDEDVLWILYHEWCHAEGQRAIRNLSILTYSPEEIKRASRSILQTDEVEEAICYHIQLERIRDGTFKVSKETLNGVVGPYTEIYNYLLTQSKGNDLKNIMLKQFVGGLTNPREYK